MTSDATGFAFLQAALNPVSDIKRGYGLGGVTTPDIKRGYGLGGVTTPDTSTSGTVGSASTVDTTQHTTSTYMALTQS